MQIVGVSTCEQRRYIPAKGWENVSKVLNTYADGFTRGARATEQVTVDAIGKSRSSDGGLQVGLFLLAGAAMGGRSQLVKNLLSEVEETLKTQTSFSRHYDYDGMGTSFFKTSVDIHVFDRVQEMYGIAIHAAYVGHEPESGLAEHFGVPRALLACSVDVETEPVRGNRFEFDFEPVLRKLDAVLATDMLTGKQVVTTMMAAGEDKSTSVVLQIKDGLEVCISPGQVERRMKYLPGKRQDTWSFSGSVLSGELRRDYSKADENAKQAPTFCVTITTSQKDDWGHSLPIWQPNLQEKAIDLAGKIAAALR